MSEPRFTPGPWVAAELGGNRSDDDAISIRDASDEWVIAQAWGDCERLAPAMQANAHLIAAAPELYALVKAIANDKSAYQWHGPAREVLAKAEGRA